MLGLLWVIDRPVGLPPTLAYFAVIAAAVGVIFLFVGLQVWAESDEWDDR